MESFSYDAVGVKTRGKLKGVQTETVVFVYSWCRIVRIPYHIKVYFSFSCGIEEETYKITFCPKYVNVEEN